MCSIIAARDQPGYDLIFLENRDKPKELYVGNDIRNIGEVVGIYDFRAKGYACGYSLDSRTAAGVANILGYTGTKSRGVLLKNALEKGRSADDVAQIIAEEARTGNYGSASYVVCDRNAIFNIESFGEKTHLIHLGQRKFFIATNHLHVLGEGRRLKDSLLREQYLKKLRKISREAVLKFATNHRKPAICRHGRTLASFAIFSPVNDKTPEILYSIGEPCKGYREYFAN